MNNFSVDFMRQYDRPPTEKEIAKEFDLKEDQVIDALLHSPIFMSLDGSIGNDDTSLLEIIADDRQISPDALMLENALKNDIYDLLDTLTDREKDVIRLYFGLDGQEWTLESIAQKYKLTRERVRQIK